MTYSIEITSMDNQIPLLLQTEKDEIEEARKVHQSIDIKETNGKDPSVNQSFEKMFKDLNNSSIKSCTIFKVNVGLRESNPDAYTPKMVSIGPYHRKIPQLGPMKKYKLLYLQRFLQRNEMLDVESCISELEKLKEEALNCYDDIEDLDSHEFCQMLLLDGCFVVEFIRENVGICPKGAVNINESSISCIYNIIFRDLLLLENQLPFFVLNQLHNMTKQDDDESLAILANKSFKDFDNLTKMKRETPEFSSETECNAGNVKHLLHAVHIFSCHGNPIKMTKYDTTQLKLMPNATSLFEAGVSFVKEDKHGDNTSLVERIKFENGKMTIPCFQVFDHTEALLRNVIAYEQQSTDVRPKYFSDYAALMDNLINSDKDVNLLQQKGIIENWIGEDKEVANLFNKIGNGVTLYYDFYYNDECIEATQHCEKSWNKMKANLKHTYFSSPWVGASTVAAIVLLMLTTIQTILAFTGSI